VVAYLSLVFSKRTIVVIGLFFTVSIAFFIYRNAHKERFAVADPVDEQDTSKSKKPSFKPDYRQREGKSWGYYFEDSVAPSGKYIYMERQDTTILTRDQVDSVLRKAGELPDSPVFSE
jgi:hypothetical protein